MDENTTVTLAEQADEHLKLASQLAATNLLFAQQELGRRMVDPTITTRGLLDIAEHSYKVSGMAKRQEAKEDGGRVVFNIIMGDGSDIKIEKEVAGEVVPDTVESLSAGATALFGALGRPDIDFGAAPEFSSAAGEV